MAERQCALITGASSGIGAGFARTLAARGLDLVLVARDRTALDTLADTLQAEHGIACTVLAADLCNPDAPAQLCAQLADRQLRIGWLVNNAGRNGASLGRGEWAEQRRFLELMIVSMAALCHELVPGMRERGFGRVINIGSVAGRFAVAHDSSYGPSKAWVIAMSQGLHRESARDGVHVCALCPGYTHTDFHRRAGIESMKQSMPSWLWYGVDTVVADGLRAVEAGKALCISGRLYRWLDPLLRVSWLQKRLVGGR